MPVYKKDQTLAAQPVIEKWLPIKDYDGLYEISSIGRVMSLDRLVVYSNGRKRIHRGTFLMRSKNKGYLIVVLSKNGILKAFSVHRLVAVHFIPNPNNKPDVNHINSNRSDASASNLEWCTKSENNIHGFIYGNMCQVGEKNGCAKITEDIAIKIKKLYANGTRQIDIVRQLNVSRSIVKDINSGRSWKHVNILNS